MVTCNHCEKSIVLTQEPKLLFTRLGNNYYHSKCYQHIVKTCSIAEFA